MSPLVGTGALVRLALRRDRFTLPPWIAAITLLCVGTASGFARRYPTPEARLTIAHSVGSNPALRALIGPPFDLGSIGGLTAWRVGGTVAVLAALMSLFTVIRHTRAEEEAGRLDLLCAGVVGRHAALTAALLVALGGNVLGAVVVVIGLLAVGLPAAGSVALGLGVASAGCVFAAVAAVAAQLTERARVARGIAGGVLGLCFVLRAVGDAGPTWLSWCSPIGWTQQLRPFAHERWWVVALALGMSVALAGAAHALVARRDVGRGLWPARPGVAEAPARLRSGFALGWRVHRGALLG
jgi:ABC-2 type transport system permease protein